MTTTVVPFRAGGKSRLPDEIRRETALAMLGDVLEAASVVGTVKVVTSDRAAVLVAEGLGAASVEDPGGGQGAAVAAALARVEGHALVVNADLPWATGAALLRLAGAGLALVAAADGTTNALSLPDPALFAPLYGAGSAARFLAHAPFASLSIAELAADVDTLEDLDRLELPLGPRTQLVTQCHAVGRGSAE